MPSMPAQAPAYAAVALIVVVLLAFRLHARGVDHSDDTSIRPAAASGPASLYREVGEECMHWANRVMDVHVLGAQGLKSVMKVLETSGYDVTSQMAVVGALTTPDTGNDDEVAKAKLCS